ncbi:MAG: hypothetical protein LN364_02890 [Candidatus Thermoplasmatota archaeon]|nr:hypothetical protein [Candidatus Thermoplasmatota archaeon]
MVGEGISEWASEFSLDKILSGDFSGFAAIFYLVVSIAIYSILIWHFYRYIARRDCFKMSPRRHKQLIGFLKYFFFYPGVAFLFFAGFSLMMLFITKTYEIETVLSTSFAIIAAIRICAYYNEDLSKDIAKMLPFALLAIFLIDASYFRFSDITAKIGSLPEFFTVAIQFIIFIILMEWILRILLAIRYAIFPKKRQMITEE